jgi:CHAT domain-containing protein
MEYAGTRSVLASQLKVDDESTAKLMKRFYVPEDRQDQGRSLLKEKGVRRIA